jgi:hypothetical protein
MELLWISTILTKCSVYQFQIEFSMALFDGPFCGVVRGAFYDSVSIQMTQHRISNER